MLFLLSWCFFLFVCQGNDLCEQAWVRTGRCDCVSAPVAELFAPVLVGVFSLDRVLMVVIALFDYRQARRMSAQRSMARASSSTAFQRCGFLLLPHKYTTRGRGEETRGRQRERRRESARKHVTHASSCSSSCSSSHPLPPVPPFLLLLLPMIGWRGGRVATGSATSACCHTDPRVSRCT